MAVGGGGGATGGRAIQSSERSYDAPTRSVVAIEWYQANGLASPHPWEAHDSRKALRLCPLPTVNMHFTHPADHRPRSTPTLGALWPSSGTRRTGLRARIHGRLTIAARRFAPAPLPTVNTHFTPPTDYRQRSTPTLGALWPSSGTRRTGQAQAPASRRRISQK